MRTYLDINRTNIDTTVLDTLQRGLTNLDRFFAPVHPFSQYPTYTGVLNIRTKHFRILFTQ